MQVPQTCSIKRYLLANEIIDWPDPAIQKLAQQLASGQPSVEAIAKACFEWVRDEIYHSSDYQLNPVTCRASDVLKHQTGYCYAKSHLLAALLRANNIPTGLCYQRLRIDDESASYCLHGLNAVYLPDAGWYRVDSRGNRSDIQAQFMPPIEQLAYNAQLPGEIDFQTIWVEPLPVVVKTLQTHTQWSDVLLHLPDLLLEDGIAE